MLDNGHARREIDGIQEVYFNYVKFFESDSKDMGSDSEGSEEEEEEEVDEDEPSANGVGRSRRKGRRMKKVKGDPRQVSSTHTPRPPTEID